MILGMQTLEKTQEKGNLMNVKDKLTIITGGTRGIGKAIAQAFAKAGADVIITGRSPESNAAEEIKAAIENPDAKVTYKSCDISQKDSVANFIKEVIDEKGKIDVLINNAGITKDTLFMRMKEDEWNSVIDTNLNSLYHICQPVIKVMSKQRSGSIINMTSVVGMHGNPAQVNYASSKAGMIGFTKALAKEYGRRGIRVNAIAPGFITTEMTGELPEEVTSKYKENIPLGDFGNTQDIADTALFLAGSAGYITGQVIQVDGGLFMQYSKFPSEELENTLKQEITQKFKFKKENVITMERDEVLNRIKKVVAGQLSIGEDEVKEASSFTTDLGADSLDTVELVMALEDEFGVEIPDEEAEKITTVAAAIDYVTSKSAA